MRTFNLKIGLTVNRNHPNIYFQNLSLMDCREKCLIFLYAVARSEGDIICNGKENRPVSHI